MNANEKLQDELIGRAVNTELFKKSLAKRIAPLLTALAEDLQKELASAEISQYRKTRVEALLRDLRALQISSYGNIQRLVDKDLAKLTAIEAAFLVGAMNGAMGAPLATLPTVNQIYAAAAARPFNGRLLKDWYKKLADDSQTRLAQQIRIGYVEGESIQRIAARIKRSINTDKVRVEAVARTAVNHISNFASDKVYKENKHLLKALQWSSTLDTRTTDICQRRDNRLFPVESGPRPPAHIGCRSRMIPVLKSARSIEGIPEETRASMDGQVPANQSYGDWLRKQGRARQEEVLGVRKAQLFREGGLDIAKFSTQDGRPLSLSELESRQPAIWQKVFGKAS